MYQFNGRKMYEGNKSVLFFSKEERLSKYKVVIFSMNKKGCSGPEDEQQ